MLGKGFYNTAGDRRVHGVNANRPLKLILQAHLYYADGTEQVVVSDGHWRTAPGPITHSAILGGEDYDARAMPDGWRLAKFDDSPWQRAVETDGPGGELRAAYSPPIKKHDVFKPVRIDEPEPGIFVYDLGQNASAIPSLRVRGQAGQKIKLTPAEQRHGSTPRRNDGRGLVNPAGVGQPNYWEYTLRGGAIGELVAAIQLQRVPICAGRGRGAAGAAQSAQPAGDRGAGFRPCAQRRSHGRPLRVFGADVQRH